MNEQWRAIPGWEGYYEVTETGLVRSLDRLDTAGRYRRGQHLTPRIDPRWGHHSAQLRRGGKRFNTNVGRLVLLAFAGPCPEGMECCHNNGDPANNNLSNLRWDTHSENVIDSILHGTHPKTSKTECIRGHAFDAENTIVRKNRRDCRKCNRQQKRDAWKRLRARKSATEVSTASSLV